MRSNPKLRRCLRIPKLAAHVVFEYLDVSKRKEILSYLPVLCNAVAPYGTGSSCLSQTRTVCLASYVNMNLAHLPAQIWEMLGLFFFFLI